MRFLCDEMLRRLGQWLRVAGHDVLMLPDGTDDRVVMERAQSEARILVTRDRSIVDQCNGAADLILLDCNDLEDCVAALSDKLAIDWLHAPFTRCMNCNAPLVAAREHQRLAVPEDVLRNTTRVMYCPNCDQLFWDGSHVARMRERLETWQQRSRAPAR